MGNSIRQRLLQQPASSAVPFEAVQTGELILQPAHLSMQAGWLLRKLFRRLLFQSGTALIATTHGHLVELRGSPNRCGKCFRRPSAEMRYKVIPQFDLDWRRSGCLAID